MSRPLVIKFGGTSLATPRRVRQAAYRVRAEAARGRQVVVVVSAAGHATDHILHRIQHSAPAGSPLAREVDALRLREIDRALATGEDRSAAVLAATLWALGVPARSLRGGEAGIRADGAFGAGRIRSVLGARLRRVLAAGVTPVVSGFQGERMDGETVTLGRGGSDTTAVAIAAALGAACDIVTDVTAVHERDPNRHRDARALSKMSHEELVMLAERGAQVVHPSAARLARASAVPLRVYHYRAPLRAPGGTSIGVDHEEVHALEAGGAA